MHYTSSVTSKGQITIPKVFRDKLGLNATDKAMLYLNERGEVVLGRPKSLPEIRAMLGRPAGRDPLTAKEKLIVAGLTKPHAKSR